jgi:hypothetical protein
MEVMRAGVGRGFGSLDKARIGVSGWLLDRRTDTYWAA